MEVLIVLVFILLLASLWDLKKGIVPNVLIAIAGSYGFLCSVYYQNFFSHIPGMIFPILLLYPFYKIGTMGAGDMKLFSVIGLYVSFSESMTCMFLAFMISAIYGVILLVLSKEVKERFSYLISYLKDCMQIGHFRYYYVDSFGKKLSFTKEQETKIHMTIPILLSVLIHLGGAFL